MGDEVPANDNSRTVTGKRSRKDMDGSAYQIDTPHTRGFGTGIGTPEGRAIGARGGGIHVDVIYNDGDPVRMETLIGLKEIFHTQLPKMPKEYIVRLVFDRKHKTLVMSRDGVPIGGITYRPFYEQGFAEIAFCAVRANEQVKGFGSRLMCELKEYLKVEGLSHFQTYADNFAIGYFSKQGFSRHIGMAKDRWVGYVKDYSGGTHMECYVHPTVPYMEQKKMLKLQRDFLMGRILERSTSSKVYKGLNFENGAKIAPEKIPGVLEAGWSPEEVKKQTEHCSAREKALLNKKLVGIWRDVDKNENAWPFREPVDTEVVTDYLDVIEEPIDLSEIKKRLDKTDPPYYKSEAMLKGDLLLMLQNCQRYNAENTGYFQASTALETLVEGLFQHQGQ